MLRTTLRNRRLTLALAVGLAMLTLLLAACGDDEEPTPIIVEKEVIKEVPVEVLKEVPVEVVREVVKEVPVERVVEKPVIREVIKEVPVEKIVVKPVVVQVEGVIETDGVLLLALGEQNDSGQSGWARLTARGDETVVVVSVPPGAAVESELLHIHAGACGNDTLRGVVHGLNSFGDGVSVTTVPASLASLRTGDFAVNAHQKGNPAVYTACGNIPTDADALTIALEELSDSGQSGWATLTARGSQTEVVVQVSPGAVESELLHIHEGQCGVGNLRGVAHGLTNIAGGVSATVVPASLASLRTGDFAVNAHQKGNPAVWTACGNIPATEGLAAPTPTPTATPTPTPTPSPTSTPTTVSVDIVNFTHQDVTITVGTTVTWTNQDSTTHTTTSGHMGDQTGIWDSPSMNRGNSFSFTFTQVGTFQYFCRIHPSIMNATVTVTADSGSSSGNSGSTPDY